MNLYSVLMVDDEQEVIEVMSRKLNWEELGFQICGRAANGVEALEMAEELQPDVVLTDIKMPYMDGLELTRRLKSLFPDIRIIIFSGFDEFEYAKEAIRLEVEEYLLKPVDAAEIRRVFGTVYSRLEEDRDRRRSVRRLEEYYQKSLPLLRESFFMSLMEGHVPEEKIQERMEEAGLQLEGPQYVIAVIHVSVSEKPQELTPRLVISSVRELAEEYFRDRWGSYIFYYRGNILLLSRLEEPEEISAYTDDCDRFCRLAKRSCQAVVTVGISRACPRIQDLSSAYEGAREALSYRVLYGTGRAINIREIVPEEDTADARYSEIMQEIFKQIKMGNEEKLYAQIDLLTDRISRSGMNIRKYRLLLMELVTGLYRLCSNNDIEFSEVSPQQAGAHNDPYSTLLKMDTPDEIRQWLKDISGQVLAGIRERRLAKTRSFVARALDFVRDHYSDDRLDVEMVCSDLGVSAAYFSTVFRKETGTAFISYLTDYRMKEAVRLIQEEDEKTYITARKVGYADPNYFSYVFKKTYGMTPTAYKRSLRGKE